MLTKIIKVTVKFCLVLLLIPLITCVEPSLLLATTTSLYDSGLLRALLPPFERENQIRVKVIAVGTGQALALGKRGDVDVILAHNPVKEEEFMAQGYGIERYPVMYNDFILVGPPYDPAGVKGLDIFTAFKKIAQKKALFISRGDNSGTYFKERELWLKAGIEPKGDWYLVAGQGMGETLTLASEKGAYTLSDRGTFIYYKRKLRLEILIEDGEILHNLYSVILVNPALSPRINCEGAKRLIAYLTSPKAQGIIEQYGKEKYGHPLFYPYRKE